MMITKNARHPASPTMTLDRFWALAVVVGLAAMLPAPRARAAVPVRDLVTSLEVGEYRKLEVDLRVGDVHIAPLAEIGQRIEVEVELLCSRLNRRCRNRAEDLAILLRPHGESIRLEIKGDDSNFLGSGPQANLMIRVPEGLEIVIDLGVGKVSVGTGVGASGIDVDLGVGDVELTLREDGISRVRLEVGVGTARIEPRTGAIRRSSFLIGANDVGWSGEPGNAKVRVDVGVGAARAMLE